MKRSILFISLLLVMIYYFIPSVTSTWKYDNYGKEGLFYESFSQTGAKVQEININGWSLLENKSLNLAEQRNYLMKILANINVAKSKKKEIDDKNYKGIQFTCWVEKDIYLSIVLQSINTKDTKAKGETYLMVSMKEKYGMQKRKSMLKLRDKIFKVADTKGNYSTYLVGKLQYNQNSQLVKKAIFTKLKAVKVQQISEGNLLSATGYTPLVSEKIQVGNDVINLNLAIRENHTTKEKYIYLGTPIITGEY